MLFVGRMGKVQRQAKANRTLEAVIFCVYVKKIRREKGFEKKGKINAGC